MNSSSSCSTAPLCTNKAALQGLHKTRKEFCDQPNEWARENAKAPFCTRLPCIRLRIEAYCALIAGHCNKLQSCCRAGTCVPNKAARENDTSKKWFCDKVHKGCP